MKRLFGILAVVCGCIAICSAIRMWFGHSVEVTPSLLVSCGMATIDRGFKEFGEGE